MPPRTRRATKQTQPGDAVLDALAGSDLCTPVRKLAVRTMPGSATSGEQLADAEIDAAAIAAAVRDLARQT